MIARLIGTLVDKRPGHVVLDVSGVGYELAVPLSTYYEIGEIGSRLMLHVQTHVRQDLLALFGFLTESEKDLFNRLLGVSGVGPKTAVAALSGLGPADLVATIRQRDARRLASVPGIGRRTAERILVELADRLETIGGRDGSGPATGGNADVRQDLLSALVNLGYNARVALEATNRALRSMEGTPPAFETLLRRTLKSLSK
jgi:holliday junction DNA helicase RuvA